jgi:uncharacterized membrane protein
MGSNNFAVEEALSFGWSTFKSNLSFLIPAAIVSILAIGALEIAAGAFMERLGFFAVLLYIVAFCLNVVLQIGWIRVILRFVDGRAGEATISELFSPDVPTFISLLIAAIIVSVAVSVGYFFLVIPGILLSIRLMFTSFLVVDQGLSPVDALGRSWAITQGSFWRLFVFLIVVVVVNVIGAIPLFLGLLVTVPTSIIAVAYVYRRMVGVGPATSSFA